MTESTELVVFSIEGNVMTITLNRPDQMNALNLPTLRQLETAIVRANVEDEVRCIVLTGAGRAFCAGADVKEWGSGESAVAEATPVEDWVTVAHRIVARLYRMPKPVIAAVNGVAVGAGLDIALACDFRIASDRARFGSVYIRLGIPPDAGASFFLPRIVGITKAKELIYTGRIIEAEEAVAIGLVGRVVTAETLASEVAAFAAELASGPTIAIGMAKENIQEHWTLSIESALRSEKRAERLSSTTADHAEGLLAVNEKRQPLFRAK
jgi:2-(1,2-epoxy-1,2-dihydrophenyl)acetyl-CoA isomerase